MHRRRRFTSRICRYCINSMQITALLFGDAGFAGLCDDAIGRGVFTMLNRIIAIMKPCELKASCRRSIVGVKIGK